LQLPIDGIEPNQKDIVFQFLIEYFSQYRGCLLRLRDNVQAPGCIYTRGLTPFAAAGRING